ncbi:hypothetical protein V8C42DRAFT_344613 [Trichoderma barbatum]
MTPLVTLQTQFTTPDWYICPIYQTVLRDCLLPLEERSHQLAPLCSHSPLMERPQGDPMMTPEQLEEYNDKRKQHVKEQIAVINKRHEDKERAIDLGAYHLKAQREAGLGPQR